MTRLITELRGLHRGRDAWIMASGASMDYVDPEFFRGRLTIAVNNMWRWFPCWYVVRKEHEGLAEFLRDKPERVKAIVSEYDCGNLTHVRNADIDDPDLYYFRHRENEHTRIDLTVMGTDDHIVVSFSTITSAMHVAAYMGAANIILCGHDCGTLDGRTNIAGYPIRKKDWYRGWLKKIEPQTVTVKDALRKVYGCRVYSLNPFVNLGLEGHKYE